MKENLIKTIILLLGLIALTIMAKSLFSSYKEETRAVSVGSKNFTEQTLLGLIYAELIEAKSDISVNRHLNLGDTDSVMKAMEAGLIDFYIEYTGTAYTNILNMEVNTDENYIYETLQKEYEKRYNWKWLKPLGFKNSYVLAVEPETARRYHLKTLSDLMLIAPALVLSTTSEFVEHPDGLPRLQEIYDITFKSVLPSSGNLIYTTLQSDISQVAGAFSTDGLLKHSNLQLLEDNRQAFPPSSAVPVINKETLEYFPELEEIINLLAGKIDAETMSELNYQVDVLHTDPQTVAKEFLEKSGYID